MKEEHTTESLRTMQLREFMKLAIDVLTDTSAAFELKKGTKKLGE